MVPPELKSSLDLLSQHPWQEFDSGETIISGGREEPMVGVVKDGIVEGVVYPRHGPLSRAALTVIGDGHFFGLEAISDDHNLEYIALTSSRVWLFPVTWLRDEAPAELLRGALFDASWQLSRTVALSYIGKLSLRQRVISRLCDLREACSLPEIAITQEDLASLVGVHRNRIGPVLKELETEGLVESGYREITIGDRESLIQAFHGDHGARS